MSTSDLSKKNPKRKKPPKKPATAQDRHSQELIPQKNKGMCEKQFQGRLSNTVFNCKEVCSKLQILLRKGIRNQPTKTTATKRRNPGTKIPQSSVTRAAELPKPRGSAGKGFRAFWRFQTPQIPRGRGWKRNPQRPRRVWSSQANSCCASSGLERKRHQKQQKKPQSRNLCEDTDSSTCGSWGGGGRQDN